MNLGYFVRGQRIRKSLIEFQFAIDPIFSIVYRWIRNPKVVDLQSQKSGVGCESNHSFHVSTMWIIVTRATSIFHRVNYTGRAKVCRPLCISRFINRCETKGSKDISMMGKLSNSRTARWYSSLPFILRTFCLHVCFFYFDEITLTLGGSSFLGRDFWKFWAERRGWARTWLVNPEIRPMLSVFPH